MSSCMPHNKSHLPADVTAVILAGGMGLRLRPVVGDRPKVLAPVGGRPFLSHILDQLADAGFRNVTICVGYLADRVVEVFGASFRGLALRYSMETTPLGTGGAVLNALPLVDSEMVLVMNGDSYLDVGLDHYLRWHAAGQAAPSMVVTEVADTRRYGRVVLDADDHVVAFQEKSVREGSGFINAGIYLFSRRLLESMGPGAGNSLEKDLLPVLAGRRLRGFRCSGDFIDIGTPESFGRAEAFFQANRRRSRDGNSVTWEGGIT